MNREEKSLLLYFETCAVDLGGKVDGRRINEADLKIAKMWNENGFVSFGRIASKDLRGSNTHWCFLSQEAWEAAHKARQDRAVAGWENRKWNKTSEL